MTPLDAALRAYRGRGADPPFGDPARAHGTPFEGYYWRIADPAAGRVVVALCGVCAGPAGFWALVTVAAHPGGFVRSELVPVAEADARDFGVRAGAVLRGDRRRLAVHAGADASIDIELTAPVPFPRRAAGALGAAHVVPGLAQYWHPVTLRAEVRGSAGIGGETVSLDGASAYVEKNWGHAFPDRWWWGHAGAFPAGDRIAVAFAGGPIRVARTPVAPTAVVLGLGDEVLALRPPLARARVAVADGTWRVAARGPQLAVDIEGDAAGSLPHRLDVPVPGAVRTEPRSRQHLAGRLALTVRRGRRTLFRGESPLAGLELGGP